jgi:hypothetical protein
VQEIGLTELREAWSGDEQAEIMVLVYQHSPANQLAVLRDASSETAIKMARMRLNHDMSLHHTSELLQRLTSGSSEGFDYAFEVVQHAADSNQLQALAAQMGGQSEVEDLFTGNMKNDVTALFAGGGG